MTPRRILLVSPAFHGYWAALAAALEHDGHEVTAHCYDRGDTHRDRWRNALAHRSIGASQRERNRAEVTQRAITVLRETRPDVVLVVKGDALNDGWWEALASQDVPTVLWLYDELERLSYTLDQLKTIGPVLSYSPNDVARLRDAGIDASLLPDGFDSLTAFTPRQSPAVNLVGARYRERERIVRMLVSHGIELEAYGREWSNHPWDLLRTGRKRDPASVGLREVSRTDYYGVMAGSLATLNIHGDGHDGLSMRTFEAPGVGGLQLIDRPSVADFYEPGVETLLYDTDAELVDLIQRAARDTAWSNRIRAAGKARTLAEHTLIHRMREVTRKWD
ncbi:spore maturation protein CgeB [Leucobacter exalbidus]|uniref:Spore maturation protein CgeB n=1 Tax=Leucobacter exalbidus TaxID=662960 RepID=A0A940PN59_9MICO|nr:glycosyltransferase [Leucobacter exalbidus]MBP1326228.1 spore maturation protein CgeB [Leucobacter exalbidus]